MTILVTGGCCNPVGAHSSGLIGEITFGKPSNLIPAITQFAACKLPRLKVLGTDCATRDSSCIRDFIHVCDIAHAHTLALKYLISEKNYSRCEVFKSLDRGRLTALETISAFEKSTGKKA